MGNVVVELDRLNAGYGGHRVLRGVTARIREGEFVGIVGPNGAGKTTLLKVLNGVLIPSSGEAKILDREVRAYTARELARRVATVPQRTTIDFAFTVWDIVLMGRYPHAGFLGGETRRDHEIARRVMDQTGIAGLALRSFGELSGGEQQRVVLARALVQEPDVLLLDEPTAHLDISFQKDILDLLHAINADQDLTVIMVIHDLNLASLYCDRLILLRDGEAVGDGPPGDLVRPEVIQAIFGSPVIVFPHPESGRPQIALARGE